MPGDMKSQIAEIMSALMRVPDIKAVAVVRRDGLAVAHDLPPSVDAKKVAAMTAAIVGTSEMATVELGQGKFRQSIIESDGGKIVSTGAGEEALIVVLVEQKANLGFVLISMERAARQLMDLLEGQEAMA